MTTTRHLQSSIVTFQGKSGARYRFHAWPLDSKFKALGGIYVVTKRECLDRTFPSMGTHRCLAVGQTANFAASVLTQSELSKLIKQGANCICVYAIAEEARRLSIEKDLIDGNEQWGGQLHYLFRPEAPERAPGIPNELRSAEIA